MKKSLAIVGALVVIVFLVVLAGVILKEIFPSYNPDFLCGWSGGYFFSKICDKIEKD